MKKELLAIIDRACDNRANDRRPLETVLSDSVAAHLGTIPEHERSAERSRIITRMSLLILKLAPSFDEKIAEAETEEERRKLRDLRDKYQYWLLVDPTHRAEKERALAICFDEVIEKYSCNDPDDQTDPEKAPPIVSKIY